MFKSILFKRASFQQAFIKKQLFSTKSVILNEIKYKRGPEIVTGKKVEYDDNKRRLKQILTLLFFSGVGYTIASEFSIMDMITIYTNNDISLRDTDILEYRRKLLHKLENLPILNRYLNDGYLATITGQEYELIKSLGGIDIPPKTLFEPKTKKLVDIVHIGVKLQGYPFMLHGGMSSDIISQFMVKCLKFEDFEGTTKDTEYLLKNLKVEYKSPVFVNRFIILKLVDVERIGTKLAKCNIEVYSENGMNLLLKGKGKFEVK
ncbi:hypothetical protein FOG51_01514 [Hanseniaspora uvarum]|jgi:hypothetical protein|uniref:Putative mitochondrial membrane protein FMP10 n=1 Tax=Hanseniaspora uvarum TaxID=29833 RepID=A0A1E5S1A6_HANUV|nr:hypothetical protein FOG48_01761 [Hanseniaspora uvarum]KAF0273478.1 hypothetical protein FOG51_01514 [Hanseniaspora uvarum]KAF0276931.1 hypothetical protein FOG50_02230 [Hanseniaspora uvarum]OEJ92743.1 putative mitochondrial membrane protein FMP10 [Hanseniaspora uvarum]